MNIKESLGLTLTSMNIASVKIDSLRMKLAKIIGTVKSYSNSEIDILTIAAEISTAVKNLNDAIDLVLIAFKNNHVEGDEIILKELEKKVVWAKAGNSTSIDSEKVIAYLLDAGRRADAIKISSVSEKDLASLEDGPVLVGKYKKIDGKKKSSVSIKELNAEERKKLIESR
jgi:hypothetical protein